MLVFAVGKGGSDSGDLLGKVGGDVSDAAAAAGEDGPAGDHGTR